MKTGSPVFLTCLLSLASSVYCGMGDLPWFCSYPNNFASSMPVSNTVIDQERYKGVWYEIGRKPNPFQSRCACSAGVYLLQNKTFFGQSLYGVRNICTLRDGRISKLYGWLFHRNEQKTKLGIQYSAFRPESSYWLLDIDPEYQWQVIGEPCRKYAWILARNTPDLYLVTSS